MLWSSWYRHDTYAIGVAYSASGKIAGPWVQEKDPLDGANCGHGMLFKTFDGKMKLCMHYVDPNDERQFRKPIIKDVDISGDRIVIKK